jgi:hypothetical protein
MRKKLACKHAPPASFVPGEPLKIDASFSAGAKVGLRYRHVNQGEHFLETAEMVIPGEYTKSPFPLMYYFVEGNSIYPGLDADLSNRPYFVVRAEKKSALAKAQRRKEH